MTSTTREVHELKTLSDSSNCFVGSNNNSINLESLSQPTMMLPACKTTGSNGQNEESQNDDKEDSPLTDTGVINIEVSNQYTCIKHVEYALRLSSYINTGTVFNERSMYISTIFTPMQCTTKININTYFKLGSRCRPRRWYKVPKAVPG